MTGRSNPSPQILRAVLRLRELILTGALPAGERVPELHLVGHTGVSRTPLRLAMERLEHEGLLERRPRGGFVVRAFSRTAIEQAIEIRGVLEGTAARLAAERDPEAAGLHRLWDAVRRIDAIIDGLPGAKAFEGYVEANGQFHDALIALAASDMLHKLAAQVSAFPFASPDAFVRTQALLPESHHVLVIAQEHHRMIVDAIGRREGARAEALVREHARLSLRNLDAALADRDARRVAGLAGAVMS
jgi:GntR family transcriptional regulator of vanillate catabolism